MSIKRLGLRSVLAFWAVFVAFTMLLSACGGSASTPTAAPTSTTASVAGEFVGVTDQGDAIGLSTNGQQLVAYACDGTPTNGITFAVWFKGAVSDNAVNLTAKNGEHLVATFTPQSAAGTVTLTGGTSFSFTASAVTGTADAGLYRDEETFAGVSYLAGWIISPASVALSAPETDVRYVVAALATTLPRANGPNGPQVESRHGGILNEKSGALLPVPDLTAQDIAARRMTVPAVGTFTMVRCGQAQC